MGSQSSAPVKANVLTSKITIMPFLEETTDETNKLTLTIGNEANGVFSSLNNEGLNCMSSQGFKMVSTDISAALTMKRICKYEFVFPYYPDDFVYADPIERFMATCKKCNLIIETFPIEKGVRAEE